MASDSHDRQREGLGRALLARLRETLPAVKRVADGVVSRSAPPDRASPLLPPLETESPARQGLLWRLSFILCVVIPAFATVVYFAFLASDQYVSESRFAVRSISGEDDATAKGALAAAASGASTAVSAINSTSQNAHIVASYIRSPAMVADMLKSVDLRAIFTRPEADFAARLKSGATLDELVAYWVKMVKASIDGPSGIVTLEIAAFRREDALMLGRETLRLSEALVNEISNRARRDATAKAEEEVFRAFGTVRKALAALQDYRNEAGLINPVETATDTGKLLVQLLAEKIRIENDLFVGKRQMSENAPTIRTLQSRLQTIDSQIAALRAKLSGNQADQDNIAARLNKFEELEVERQFAEKRYEISLASLDRARIIAERQNVYLTTFVQPTTPEQPRFPRRLALSLLLPGIFFALWSIAALIWASVEDHRL
ncbi:MAG: capsule biosynthesis protein [Alphaproteobacteria bacterium]|nr:capsule biosynthesis protein [Alphaproteobacteria bacterium]